MKGLLALASIFLIVTLFLTIIIWTTDDYNFCNYSRLTNRKSAIHSVSSTQAKFDRYVLLLKVQEARE